jgi:hypothetical protein
MEDISPVQQACGVTLNLRIRPLHAAAVQAYIQDRLMRGEGNCLFLPTPRDVWAVFGERIA